VDSVGGNSKKWQKLGLEGKKKSSMGVHIAEFRKFQF
jgi:hypothetical protein